MLQKIAAGVSWPVLVVQHLQTAMIVTKDGGLGVVVPLAIKCPLCNAIVIYVSCHLICLLIYVLYLYLLFFNVFDD